MIYIRHVLLDLHCGKARVGFDKVEELFVYAKGGCCGCGGCVHDGLVCGLKFGLLGLFPGVDYFLKF